MSNEDVLSWLEKRKLLPLLNTSEEMLTLTEIAGFLFGNGARISNKIVIESEDRLVLEVLRERLRRFQVSTNLTAVNDNGKSTFELVLEDNVFPKLLKLLGLVDDFGNLRLPNWLREDDIPLVAMFLSGFLTTKLDEIPTSGTEKVELLRSLRNDELQIVRKMLELFHIDSKLVRKGQEIGLEVELTEGNLFRVRSLISLAKIYPLSIFPTPLDFDNSDSSNLDLEVLYELIQKLLDGDSKLTFEANSKGGEKDYLSELIDAGIARREGKYIRLNFSF